MIPQEYTYDDDYIKRRGIIQTPNKKINAILSKEKVQVYLTVAQMVDYFTEGVTVELLDRKTMLEIYDNIQNYINEWKDYLQYSINANKENYKEMLIAFDKFSKVIYDKASAHEIMKNTIQKLDFGMKSNMAKIKEQEVIANTPKPDYESIAEYLRSKKPLSRY
jgi:arginyl-tRNA synthetase